MFKFINITQVLVEKAQCCLYYRILSTPPVWKVYGSAQPFQLALG